MAHDLSLVDRLRIERVVWSLDQQLYDLPRALRISTRREVRENLLTAARDVGAKDALRRLGSSRQLAAQYLDAEYGDFPRPYLMTAAVFFLTAQLVLTSMLAEASFAFRDGVLAGDPSATGTFHWPGIPYLQDDVTWTLTGEGSSSVGGAWTPLAWLLWIGATILVGRLWRVPALISRRRDRAQMLADS